MHEDTFARRVKYARGHFSTKGHFCTKVHFCTRVKKQEKKKLVDKIKEFKNLLTKDDVRGNSDSKNNINKSLIKTSIEKKQQKYE